MQIATATLTAANDRYVSGHIRYSRVAWFAITVVFGGFAVWASLAPLDSAAVAPGKVAVDGERKPVQHLEGGIVQEILVREGQTVKAGDVLFRLQPTQAQANAETLQKQIDQAMALEARLVAELQTAERVAWPIELDARRTVKETALAMLDQDRQFAERKRMVETQVAILQARLDQTGSDMTGRQRRTQSLATQHASLANEVAAVSGLAERGYYPRNKLAGLQRELARLEGDLGSTQAEASKIKDLQAETRLQITQAQKRNIEEATVQLPEVRARLSDMREKLSVARDVLSRIDVRAPAAGVLLGLKINGVGSVVGAGALLAEVVPQSESLSIASRVSPLDVQAVAVGQKATVRFPGLSSRTTPVIFGRVELVAADSTVDEATKDSYFNAKITIDKATLPVDVVKSMTPGMPADVMISTGERTAFDYLIGPLRDTLAKAMRER